MNIVKKPRYESDQRRGRPERRRTSPKRISVDREALAWAAGFFDGEGCFARNDRVNPAYLNKYVASVGQVDKRALIRFQGAVQLGRIYGPYGPYSGALTHSPHYRIDIYGFEQVQALLALLWTWLGPVKREQAKAVLYT